MFLKRTYDEYLGTSSFLALCETDSSLFIRQEAPKRKHMIGTTPPPEAPPSLVRLRTKTSSDSQGENSQYTTPPKKAQKFDSPMDTSSSKLLGLMVNPNFESLNQLALDG